MNQQVGIGEKEGARREKFIRQCCDDGLRPSRGSAGLQCEGAWVINRPNGHARQRIGGNARRSTGMTRQRWLDNRSIRSRRCMREHGTTCQKLRSHHGSQKKSISGRSVDSLPWRPAAGVLRRRGWVWAKPVTPKEKRPRTSSLIVPVWWWWW